MRKAGPAYLPGLIALFIGIAGWGICLQPAGSYASEMRGIVESVVPKVQSIQILDSATGQSAVIAMSKDVVYVNAKSLQDIQVNDIVIVELQAGQVATKLTRAVVPIGPEQVLGVDELASLLKGSSPVVLVDSRPKVAFDEGHIPKAISVYVEELPRQWNKLPSDKNTMVVFYCSGST